MLSVRGLRRIGSPLSVEVPSYQRPVWSLHTVECESVWRRCCGPPIEPPLLHVPHDLRVREHRLLLELEGVLEPDALHVAGLSLGDPEVAVLERSLEDGVRAARGSHERMFAGSVYASQARVGRSDPIQRRCVMPMGQERTKEKLYQQAKRLNIKGRSKMNKGQLKAALARKGH